MNLPTEEEIEEVREHRRESCELHPEMFKGKKPLQEFFLSIQMGLTEADNLVEADDPRRMEEFIRLVKTSFKQKWIRNLKPYAERKVKEHLLHRRGTAENYATGSSYDATNLAPSNPNVVPSQLQKRQSSARKIK